jgi:hypothetical protein
MESQLGAICDLVWTADGSGSMATASKNGSVCVWNTAVSKVPVFCRHMPQLLLQSL